MSKKIFHNLGLRCLKLANQARVGLFTNNLGFIAHAESDGSDWSLNDWLVALGGEVGEAMNIAKKYHRGDLTKEEFKAKFSQELGDIQIYLDLVAQRAGIDLSEATIKSFNDKSALKKLPIFIARDGTFFYNTDGPAVVRAIAEKGGPL